MTAAKLRFVKYFHSQLPPSFYIKDRGHISSAASSAGDFMCTDLNIERTGIQESL